MMDLHNYPLDSQNCTIEIESCELIKIIFVFYIKQTKHVISFIKDGYTSDEVNICWKNSKTSVSGVDKVHLPQFKILDYKTSTYVEYLATGRLKSLLLNTKYLA
jgi:gamma-aminobutyric acid receptor subunit beta